jgi:hypothetical protein
MGEPSGVRRKGQIIRTLARCATGAAAVELGVCLYTLIAGGFRIQTGPLRIISKSWRPPFTQAVILGLMAAWLFRRDAALRGEYDATARLVRRALSRTVAMVKTRPLWGGVFAGVMASLLVCARVIDHSLIVGSAEGGWKYGFFRPFGPEVIAIFAGVTALASALLLWQPADRGARSEWIAVCFCVFAAIGLQALLRSLAPFSAERIFRNDGPNSFYTVTQQYGAGRVLEDFLQLRDRWPLHAHSNMPGKLLLLFALERLSNDPAVLAWLVVAVSNIGGIFLYVFVRDLFADRCVAWFSLVLYLFVPGKLYFMPLMNIVTPAVAFAVAVLMLRWLRTGRLLFAAAAGASLYGLVLFEPLPLVLGVLFAILAVRAICRSDLTWRRFIAQSGALVLAFLATHAIFRLWLGFDLFVAFHRVALDAAAFNEHAGRPYGVWVRQNLIDFLFSCGVCQAVLFWIALGDGLWNWRRPDLPMGRTVVLVCAGVAISVLALDIAGINRGEVVRLWIFLACLFQIPAAYLCARLNSRAALALVLATTVLQAALGIKMIGFIKL